MTVLRTDVLGIGNAIVDVIARADDDFLARQNMRKGAMALIDEAQATSLYDAMGPAVEVSGGSAANTIVGVASLGGRAAFVGKVKDDEFGRTGGVVFAKERELGSLYQTADFDGAVAALRNDARLAVVTRSEKGCVVVTRETIETVPACPIARVVDATGAGDLFAAGFLIGLSRGADHGSAARLGALAAAEVISHLGARPETSLKTLAREQGFSI